MARRESLTSPTARRSFVALRGKEALQRNFERLGKRATRVLTRALKEEQAKVIADAKPLVPWRSGELRESGVVGRARRVGDEIQVPAGFGNKYAWYAIIVHERTDLKHKPPTKAKFLEIPFKRRVRGIIGRLARAIRIAVLRHVVR